tara:strand:- start:12 stop:305 length:294 start_codon:yes stop_codon:yes gene_type:complete
LLLEFSFIFLILPTYLFIGEDMKFLVDTAKDFGLGILGAFLLFGYAFTFVTLLITPFVVPMYVNSLVEGHLGAHWILFLIIVTAYIEFVIVRLVEGD